MKQFPFGIQSGAPTRWKHSRQKGGHEDGTAQIDIATVFREALKAGAEEIIVAHNHPSGKLTPCKADLRLTEELRSRAEWLGVGFLDHIILGASNSTNGFDFISLAEILP